MFQVDESISGLLKNGAVVVSLNKICGKSVYRHAIGKLRPTDPKETTPPASMGSHLSTFILERDG